MENTRENESHETWLQQAERTPQMQWYPPVPPAPAKPGWASRVLMIISGVLGVLSLFLPLAAIEVLGMYIYLDFWGMSILGVSVSWFKLNQTVPGLVMLTGMGLVVAGVILSIVSIIRMGKWKGKRFAAASAITTFLGLVLFWVEINMMSDFTGVNLIPYLGSITLFLSSLLATISAAVARSSPKQQFQPYPQAGYTYNTMPNSTYGY